MNKSLDQQQCQDAKRGEHEDTESSHETVHDCQFCNVFNGLKLIWAENRKLKSDNLHHVKLFSIFAKNTM